MSTDEKLLCRQCWAPLGETIHCETCGRYRVARRDPVYAAAYLTYTVNGVPVSHALTAHDVRFLRRIGIAID